MATARIETAEQTIAKNAALNDHMSRVKKHLAALAAQETEAQGKHGKVLHTLQAETDAGRRIALKAEAAHALEGVEGIHIARANVENNYAELSKDVAQSITLWLDTVAAPALEADVTVRQAELDAAQARFDDAYTVLSTARGLHAQAAALCRAIDEDFVGLGATNGPEYAANRVDDMWITLASLHAAVDVLAKKGGN